MKFTLPITLLAGLATVNAAAVADHDKRYCEVEGGACHTVKRAAHAFWVAVRDNARIPARDEVSNELSYIASRQLNELALAIAASQDDPEGYYAAIATPTEADTPTKREAEASWCTKFLGQPCWKREASPSKTDKDLPTKREAEASWCTKFLGQPCWKREAEPSKTEQDQPTKREAEASWCTKFLGQPCWKREAHPEAEAEANGWCARSQGQPCWKRDPEAAPTKTDRDQPTKREAEPSWCTKFLGQPCWKRDALSTEKREADPFCSRFTGSSCWKRDESATALEQVKRCTEVGQACWKAKRAAAAVINAIDSGNALKLKREVDAKREASCSGPNGICTKATRDLHAMYNAARTIIEA
ncbi:hypothetical protein VTJ04DRAFT_3520 [Mycothermus thermophilus]|uniref:uncharacterized protein n=1 Tax=Humicola insolens TaxID=85995 RepID=UPI0037447E33